MRIGNGFMLSGEPEYRWRLSKYDDQAELSIWSDTTDVTVRFPWDRVYELIKRLETSRIGIEKYEREAQEATEVVRKYL